MDIGYQSKMIKTCDKSHLCSNEFSHEVPICQEMFVASSSGSLLNRIQSLSLEEAKKYCQFQF